MKKIVILTSILCLLFSCCYAESPDLHRLWDIDLNTMDVQQVHDYLDQQKGILSAIVWNYDKAGHNSLNSLDDQDITLFGFPFSVSYTEYKRYQQISLYFGDISMEDGPGTILTAIVNKYGNPTLSYYDIYTKSPLEWRSNIREPMYHDLILTDDPLSLDLPELLHNWEYYAPGNYSWGEIDLTIFIDNIEITVYYKNNNCYSMYVRFLSYLPELEIEELHESKNLGEYTDTGF